MSRREEEYWIDCKGRVHKWDGDSDVTSFHHEIAAKFFPEYEFPEDFAMSLGWLRIGSVRGNYKTKELTQSQLDTVFDLGLKDFKEINIMAYNKNYRKLKTDNK